MKAFIFCTLVFISGTVNARETSTDDMKWLNLQGPVKTMESGTWDVKTGKQIYDWEDGIYKMNADGKIAEKTRYKVNGELDYIETTTFNNDGNAVSSVKTNSSGVVVENSSYSYDSKKNLTGKTSVKPNGEKTFELSVVYDANGNVVKKTIHTYEDGKITFDETIGFSYHPGTTTIKTELQEGKVYDYDHPEKSKIFSTTLNKDAAGNITDETTTTTTTLDNKSETIKKAYSYNSLPNKASQEKASIDNRIVSISDFSYDANGNIASEKKTFYPGEEFDKISFTYEYDAHSNWIKCIKFLEHAGKEPEAFRLVRTITYF